MRAFCQECLLPVRVRRPLPCRPSRNQETQASKRLDLPSGLSTHAVVHAETREARSPRLGAYQRQPTTLIAAVPSDYLLRVFAVQACHDSYSLVYRGIVKEALVGESTVANRSIRPKSTFSARYCCLDRRQRGAQ